MKWRKHSPWCLESECRRYTVAKFRQPDGWVYAAYRGKALLVTATTADECKQACEQHERQR